MLKMNNPGPDAALENVHLSLDSGIRQLHGNFVELIAGRFSAGELALLLSSLLLSSLELSETTSDEF